MAGTSFLYARNETPRSDDERPGSCDLSPKRELCGADSAAGEAVMKIGIGGFERAA